MGVQFLTNNSNIFFFLILLLLFSSITVAQVKIKERIDINPEGNVLYKILGDTVFIWGCWYDATDTTEFNFTITPEVIAPGQSAIVDLGFNEDNYEILLKSISTDPQWGIIRSFGHEGEYLYTAPNILPGDSSRVITINYYNYHQECTVFSKVGNDLEKGDEIMGCMDWCHIPHVRTFAYMYGSEQVTIQWDTLVVSISPTELFPGDTADVIIKKRLSNGTLVDFDTTQTFEAAMLDGCLLGNILVGDSLDAYFYDVGPQIKFVADSAADSSGVVLLRIGLVDEELKNNKLEKVTTAYCFIGELQTTSFALLPVEVEVFDHFEITIIPTLLPLRIHLHFPRPQSWSFKQRMLTVMMLIFKPINH